jgi:maltose O-acetyltransferase
MKAGLAAAAYGGRMSSEKEKMLSGELYRAGDPELVTERRRARELLRRLPGDPAVLEELIGHLGAGAEIVAPFACDYGYNISLGPQAFVNTGCVFLDCASIEIGERAQIGPAVQLLTADHPRDAQTRRAGLESAKPISIGADAWLGGGVIVLPGRSVGAESVVGAGSVVTRDVPPGTVAAGNPARRL